MGPQGQNSRVNIKEKMVADMNRKIPSAIADIMLNRATFTNMPINGLTFVNFSYGSNGAGKSSVAHAIEENDGIVWSDGRSAEDFDVLVYS